MTGDCHVRICGSPGLRCPGPPDRLSWPPSVLPDGGESALPPGVLGFQPRGSPGRAPPLSTVRMAEMGVFPVHDVCSIATAMPCRGSSGRRVAGVPGPASAQTALNPPDPARPVLLARHELPTRPVLRAVETSASITSSGSMTARTGWTSRRRGARPHGEARAPTRHDVWRTATTSVLAVVRSLSPERWEARTPVMANRRRL